MALIRVIEVRSNSKIEFILSEMVFTMWTVWKTRNARDLMSWEPDMPPSWRRRGPWLFTMLICLLSVMFNVVITPIWLSENNCLIPVYWILVNNRTFTDFKIIITVYHTQIGRVGSPIRYFESGIQNTARPEKFSRKRRGSDHRNP